MENNNNNLKLIFLGISVLIIGIYLNLINGQISDRVTEEFLQKHVVDQAYN
jgi:sorbitol-specific phosphotransferase system component IIC